MVWVINQDNYSLNEAFFPLVVLGTPTRRVPMINCHAKKELKVPSSSFLSFPEFSSQIPRCESSSVMTFPKELTHGKQSTPWKD